MKFMRLGSKPDCFTTLGNVTTARSELKSDIVLDVDSHKFHLHLFPLLAKCGALSRIVAEAAEAGEDEVTIEGFPGGASCFEACAKFCYGVLTTLNAHNVSEVRCGAEFLNMSEMVEKGNLLYKVEVFLNTSILRGWRDSIICLQSSKVCLPWSENLKIIDRCIDSVSSKITVDPAKVEWSFSYTKAMALIDHVSVSQITSPAVWNGVQGQCPCLFPVPNDWWVQDLCDLDIDLFWRVMVAVKAKGVASDLVGEALRVYTLRWLPEESVAEPPFKDYDESATKQQQEHRKILETIVSLLPAERGSATCSFLLKLLKATITLNATSLNLRFQLARRIGLQLEEASLGDLLLPSLHDSAWYDVDTVMLIVEHYLLQSQSPPTSPQVWNCNKVDLRRSMSADHIDITDSRRSTALSHASTLKVAKLIDGYLAEIAQDPNLPLGKFVLLADCIPDFARPFHDGLYRAVDMYLKEHPELSKGDRKKVSKLLNCRKLSVEACMHAAQNDRLPLRTVVQVLFIEQVRNAASGGYHSSDMPNNVRALLGPDSGDELSMSDGHTGRTPSMSTLPGASGWHSDFSSRMTGDLKNRMTSGSARERHAVTSLDSLKPPKPKGLFFRPKMFFQKLFSKKVSNSASSRESDTQSFSRPASEGRTPTRTIPTRTRRHSVA